MSLEEFPQKLFWKKKKMAKNQLRNHRRYISCDLHIFCPYRSFSEPSTKGFGTLLFVSSLVLECNFPTAIFNPENLYPRNLPRAGILVPIGMDFSSGLCVTFMFEELSWGQQPCCLEFRHSASLEVACVRFACSAPTLRVGSPGIPLDWPLQSRSSHCSRNRTRHLHYWAQLLEHYQSPITVPSLVWTWSVCLALYRCWDVCPWLWGIVTQYVLVYDVI